MLEYGLLYYVFHFHGRCVIYFLFTGQFYCAMLPIDSRDSLNHLVRVFKGNHLNRYNYNIYLFSMLGVYVHQ